MREKRRKAVALPATAAANIGDGKTSHRPHDEKHAELGFCGEEFQAMIHIAIAPEKVDPIKGARDAVNAEWKTLFDLEVFVLEEIMDQDDVIKMYEEKDQKVHFGSVRALCHEKHSEICLADPEYKGRAVSRGDIVRDSDGYYAVFSEQGTSSSHMVATKFLDAIARLPDCDGEDSDAMHAYTQVKLNEIDKIWGNGHEFVDAWVSLPRSKIPARFHRSSSI